MKRIFVAMAVALLATACGPSANVSQGSNEPILYVIDGKDFTGDINRDFIYRMLDMAYAGHAVTFGSEAGRSNSVGSSEVYNYSTSSRESAFRWARRMSRGGFTITVVYNNKTSKYHCTARR